MIYIHYESAAVCSPLVSILKILIGRRKINLVAWDPVDLPTQWGGDYFPFSHRLYVIQQQLLSC